MRRSTPDGRTSADGVRRVTSADGTQIALYESEDPTAPLQTDVACWAPNLSVQVIRGGHWLPRNDPGLVARLTLEHTRRVAGWQL